MKNIEILSEYLQNLFYGQETKKVPESEKELTGKIISNFLNCILDYSEYLAQFESLLKSREKYSKTLQNKFDAMSNKMLRSAYSLELIMPKRYHKSVRQLFRNCIKSYIFKSKLIKRYFDKPRGYPGDFIMFETIYDFKPLSKGIGLYFDNYVLSYSLAQSVVNRKNKMKDYLKSFINNHKGDVVKIINIGCGSCREIRELLNENRFTKEIDFTLIDQDEGGLVFSRKKLGKLEKNIKINSIHKEAINLMGLGKNRISFNKTDKDLIYSMGVVDYFLDNTFENFIRFHYKSLKPGGRLIVASCSSEKPEIYTLLTWFSEWFFFYRNTKDVEKILKNKIKIKKVKFSWERNREVFFIIIDKS